MRFIRKFYIEPGDENSVQLCWWKINKPWLVAIRGIRKTRNLWFTALISIAHYVKNKYTYIWHWLWEYSVAYMSEKSFIHKCYKLWELSSDGNRLWRKNISIKIKESSKLLLSFFIYHWCCCCCCRCCSSISFPFPFSFDYRPQLFPHDIQPHTRIQ